MRNLGLLNLVVSLTYLCCVISLSLVLLGCTQNRRSLDQDETLQQLLNAHDVEISVKTSDPDENKIVLGAALFFDSELSGNRDVSCATCHHPLLHTADQRSLSIGTGGIGLGESRVMIGATETTPRNSTDLFQRGSDQWHTMFWDGRLEMRPDGRFNSPADDELPDEISNILAAQALFPIISRTEMRGEKGDRDIHGQPNELAQYEDWQHTQIWQAVMDRLLAIPEYVDLFRAAYPEVEKDAFSIVHFADALAAYQADTYTFYDAPWDLYLAGDLSALTEIEKEGAILFFGKAACGQCHSGYLLTDQEFYHLAVPHLGPGKVRDYDFGRYHADQDPDYFAFRTPPLRNVALTGPYMHNGAYHTLEEVIWHHMSPLESFARYQPTHLEEEVRQTYLADPYLVGLMLDSYEMHGSADTPSLTPEEIDRLIVFLGALTSPAAQDLAHLIPADVPSGLPVVSGRDVQK